MGRGPAWALRPRAALRRAPSAAAPGRRSPAPSPSAPRRNPCRFQHHQRQACSLDTPAGVFLCAPSPCAKTHTNTETHSSPCIPDAKTSRSRCSPAPGRSRLARRPLAHLIQAVDFLRGIHDFPAAGALGVHCRGSQGRRLCGSGWGLRGAAVTSPGEPRTASGQAGGLRAAGRRGRESAPDPWLAGRAMRGKGCGGAGGCAAGPGAGGRPRSLAPARLRLGLRAARSASLALQVRVTHTDTGSRPSRSLAPPPRCRRRRAGQTHRRARTQVAGNEHVGHRGGRAQRVKGGARPGELRRQPWAATVRPGSEPGTAAAAGGGQVGGGGGGKRWRWEKLGGRGGGAQTRALPALPLLSSAPAGSPHSQTGVPGTQRTWA